MSHDLEFANGRWSFVFDTIEGPGWHNLGEGLPNTASVAEWRKAAGHDYTVEKRPVLYRDASGALRTYENRYVHARTDNGHPFGVVSDVYKTVQPQEIDDICDKFAALADGQLVRSAAFTLRSGDMICSSYAWNGDLTVAGDKHKAHLMGTTTMDGSGSTLFWPSTIRAVCKNTIEAGLGIAGAKGRVAIRHSAKLDPDKVRDQLADIAKAVTAYKALGDKLAQHSMSNEQIGALFKAVLDIPQDATQDKAGNVVGTTTRKFNQFRDLCQAFAKSKQERAGDVSAFTALQGVTRYVDHVRSVKSNGTDETVARFDSANFGTGADLKGKAIGLLVPLFNIQVAA